MTANEKKILVGKFMGFDLTSRLQAMALEYSEFFNYDSNWNSLMPVIEEIENLEDGKYFVNIRNKHTQIIDVSTNSVIIDVQGDTRIDGAFNAIVEFINK